MQKFFLATIGFFGFYSSFWAASGCSETSPGFSPDTNTLPEFTSEHYAPITGAERSEEYLPLLQDLNVGVVMNHTSLIGDTHLLDFLLEQNIRVAMVFAPEHGIRGTADAGAHISGGIDSKTGVPVRSLYGNTRKPDPADMASIDVVLFDLQDVGARFYTYISTLHYVMQAGAEAGKPVIVLDRPNPNGHYVDGPVLKPQFRSFVGMHPVPVVHGMTIGEYAMMVNGEGWLGDGLVADLTVITCLHYTHDTPFAPPVRPSPNLPNYRSILLYPFICFFEATPISVGRGTSSQFQVIGAPALRNYPFSFTPVSREGATNPPHKGKECFGLDLTHYSVEELHSRRKLDLQYLIRMYRDYPDQNNFFNVSFFNRLAGTDELMKQLIRGDDEATIRAGWQSDLEAFKRIRSRYLLYPDFSG